MRKAKGQSLTEYAFIGGIIAVGCIGALVMMGTSLGGTMKSLISDLEGSGGASKGGAKILASANPGGASGGSSGGAASGSSGGGGSPTQASTGSTASGSTSGGTSAQGSTGSTASGSTTPTPVQASTATPVKTPVIPSYMSGISPQMAIMLANCGFLSWDVGGGEG